MEGVEGAPGIILSSLESQQMQGCAKTPQRCTEVCHVLLKTTAHVLRQKVIKKSEGWPLSSFSFLFVLSVFSASFHWKVACKVSILDKYLRAQELSR